MYMSKYKLDSGNFILKIIIRKRDTFTAYKIISYLIFTCFISTWCLIVVSPISKFMSLSCQILQNGKSDTTERVGEFSCYYRVIS